MDPLPASNTETRTWGGVCQGTRSGQSHTWMGGASCERPHRVAPPASAATRTPAGPGYRSLCVLCSAVPGSGSGRPSPQRAQGLQTPPPPRTGWPAPCRRQTSTDTSRAVAPGRALRPSRHECCGPQEGDQASAGGGGKKGAPHGATVHALVATPPVPRQQRKRGGRHVEVAFGAPLRRRCGRTHRLRNCLGRSGTTMFRACSSGNSHSGSSTLALRGSWAWGKGGGASGRGAVLAPSRQRVFEQETGRLRPRARTSSASHSGSSSLPKPTQPAAKATGSRCEGERQQEARRVSALRVTDGCRARRAHLLLRQDSVHVVVRATSHRKSPTAVPRRRRHVPPSAVHG
jgi:hypothetical protein